MWNDTDTPLALFITFRCRGTWLHGDERTSIDRHHNTYLAPRIAADQKWEAHNRKLLNGDPAHLNAECRHSIEKAIRETCKIRGWELYAFNIRTNHLHIVVAVYGKEPSLVLHALKANATRQMRSDGCWPYEYSPWADKGSNRRLWNEKHIDGAVNYVMVGQGDDLPDVDQ